MSLAFAASLGLAAFVAGSVLGRRLTVQSLLIGADDPGRTPHKLGDRFYYLVPESEYVKCRLAVMREDANAS